MTSTGPAAAACSPISPAIFVPASPAAPSRPASLPTASPTARPKRQRTRSWLNGGASHVRYDHRQRPARLDVRCPRCDQRALAAPPAALLDAMPDVRIAADGNALWDQPFDLRCTACLYRAQGVPYGQLPPLFHQISVGGRSLWAWNSEHLDMIAQALQGRDVRRHPYGFFATYLQRGWPGAVEIGFAKRFFEAKAANARRKRAQGLDTLQAFSTQQLRVLTENTAATPNLNSP